MDTISKAHPKVDLLYLSCTLFGHLILFQKSLDFKLLILVFTKRFVLCSYKLVFPCTLRFGLFQSHFQTYTSHAILSILVLTATHSSSSSRFPYISQDNGSTMVVVSPVESSVWNMAIWSLHGSFYRTDYRWTKSADWGPDFVVFAVSASYDFWFPLTFD